MDSIEKRKQDFEQWTRGYQQGQLDCSKKVTLQDIHAQFPDEGAEFFLGWANARGDFIRASLQALERLDLTEDVVKEMQERLEKKQQEG